MMLDGALAMPTAALAAVLLDRLLGEPRRFHPLVGFGALVAADASALYARNILDFLKLVLTKEGTLNVDMADDIVAACLVTQAGAVTRK